ncbi:hypothetical protein LBMAG48_11170 [Phycisphaerae bacterium]|nr:hypothetical protein LBMAG48_11170 [Phycisphaerae bacterium]
MNEQDIQIERKARRFTPRKMKFGSDLHSDSGASKGVSKQTAPHDHVATTSVRDQKGLLTRPASIARSDIPSPTAIIAKPIDKAIGKIMNASNTLLRSRKSTSSRIMRMTNAATAVTAE